FMQSNGYDPNDVSTDISMPQGIGNVAAAAVLDYRHQDGSNQLAGYADTSGYKPVNPPLDVAGNGPFTAIDPSRWQPLVVVNPAGGTNTQIFATPHWGSVTPFALNSGAQFRAPPPPAFGSVAYVAE